MTKKEIATLYDSFPPEMRDCSRETFIQSVSDILDPDENSRILDNMVRQKATGRQSTAEINRALKI